MRSPPGSRGYERGDIVVFRDPGGWLPPCERPDRPADRRGHRLGPRARGPLRPRQRRPSREAAHRAPRRPRGVLQRARADHGQRRPDRRDRLREAAIAASRSVSADPFDVVVPDDSLWVLGDNRYRSKDSRYNTDQPGDGFVPDRQRRRQSVPRPPGRSAGSVCSTSTTRCSPAFPTRPRRTSRRDRRGAPPDARATPPAGASDRDRVRRGRPRGSGGPGRRRRRRDRRRALAQADPAGAARLQARARARSARTSPPARRRGCR